MTTATEVRRRRPIEKKNVFALVTPEGVPLELEIANAGDRITAFMLDALIIGVISVVVSLLAMLSQVVEFGAVSLVVSFVLRNFYFMFFEQKWQGATPGKRNRRLRVIDAGGGLLSVEAVIVRNLTRDIETFIPLAVLLAPTAIWPTAPAFVAPVAGLWFVVLGLMPLFNKNRRRVGDLIAGTMVIASPQVELLGDLADNSQVPEAADASAGVGVGAGVGAGYTFSKAHLSVYGVYELQVLEKVLRRSGFEAVASQMETIREKICAKIAWTEPVPDDYLFLAAFYAAQRAFLEGRMLMGDRREDKFAGIDPAAEKDE
jgi:uncharacterized RDD family membrane protein YckC